MTNRRGLFVLALATSAVATGVLETDAEARPRPAGRASNFTANKTFGLGLMLGAPSGLSGKYFFGPSTAFDFGVGIIRYCCRGDRDGLHLHGDLLFHPISLTSQPAFELPLYVGVGFRLWDFDDNEFRDDGFALGVRAPIGIAFDFNNVPLDVFIELALVIDFFFNYRDEVDGDLNGAIGVRYWFE